MHVDHVDRPLVVLVRHMRTDKALSLQHVHDLFRRCAALRDKQCETVVFLQLFRQHFNEKLLRGIADHPAVPGAILSRIDACDQKDLPAALSADQVCQLHVL